VIERRLYFHVDWLMLVAILLLCGISLAMVYSTTWDPARNAASRLYVTQTYAIAIGLVALVACLSIDYRSLADSSHVFYVIVLALLIYTLFFGAVVGGGRRWIPLRFFNLQPSEFAKLAVALVLAKFFDESRRGNPTIGDLMIGGAIVLVPFVLIFKEPDLGTAVTLLPIFLGIAYLAGLRLRLLGIVILAFVLMAPVAWKFGLKDYQRSRISAFLDPSQDPQGAGYQQIQAGQGIPEGHAGAAALPACRPERLHLFGAQRGAGADRGAGDARPLPLRDSPFARDGPARAGPSRHVPGHRCAVQLHLPGSVQHQHVGRAGAGEGPHAAADELRRLVDDRHPGGLRPHPQREDAAVHELAFAAARH
jgi:hypothetical protein